jgi:hypothetical protein
MAIRVRCPNGHRWKVKTTAAGTKVACPRCQVDVPVPPPAAESRPGPLWLRLVVFLLMMTALASPVAAVFALGKLGQSRAGAVAHSFLDAVARQDSRAAEALMTTATANQQGLEAFVAVLRNAPASFQIDQVNVKGEIATVDFDCGQEQKGQLELHSEAGEWRVQFQVLLRDGQEVANTQNLARKAPPGNPGGNPQQNSPFLDKYRLTSLDRTEVVDLRQFEDVWGKEFVFRERPGKEVLQALAAYLGLTLQVDDEQQGSLVRPVTLAGPRRSPLEAIEEVCRQLGGHPHYESSTAAPGPGPDPDGTLKPRPPLPAPTLRIKAGPLRRRLLSSGLSSSKW